MRKNSKRCTPRHIVFKSLKEKHKRRNLKVERRDSSVHRISSKRLRGSFLSENMEAIDNRMSFKVLKEKKNCQSRIAKSYKTIL